jgi:hypothetical protein
MGLTVVDSPRELRRSVMVKVANTPKWCGDPPCQRHPRMTPAGSSVPNHRTISSRTAATGRRCGPLNAHSQITRTRQSFSARAACTLRSRAVFPSIFRRQKAVRVPGHLNIGHSWPCQKHPLSRCTKLGDLENKEWFVALDWETPLTNCT